MVSGEGVPSLLRYCFIFLCRLLLTLPASASPEQQTNFSGHSKAEDVARGVAFCPSSSGKYVVHIAGFVELTSIQFVFSSWKEERAKGIKLWKQHVFGGKLQKPKPRRCSSICLSILTPTV